MRIPAAIWILSAIFGVVPACAPSKPVETKPAKAGPELVGRIASIPADKRFVLIQSYGSWNIETGKILTARGEDSRIANLVVTGEKLGQFAAADVQSGTVEIGDAVYTSPQPTPLSSPRQIAKPLKTRGYQQNPKFKKIIKF